MSKELIQRKQNRIIGRDYGKPGVFFVTLCVKDRHFMLWDEEVGATCGRPLFANPPLSRIGIIIHDEIHKIHSIYALVGIIKYVIMPNHIHLLIEIRDGHQNSGRPQVAPTLSRIIQQFKGSITKQIGYSIWQRSFHDHIISSKEEYHRICEYIESNPQNWNEDCFYPKEDT